VIVDDDGFLAAERIAGTAVETLSEEGCQERYPEHRPAQALVCVQERAAADPAEEGDSQVAQTPAQNRKTPQSVMQVETCVLNLKVPRGDIGDTDGEEGRED
jgi:hypothetical protein